MIQPTPNRVRFQDIAVAVAFDQQVVSGVDHVDVEVERHEPLRSFQAQEGKIAKIEGRSNPVDVEYDRDQRWTAGVAPYRQLRQQAAKRDIGMPLPLDAGGTQGPQKLRKGRIRI